MNATIELMCNRAKMAKRMLAGASVRDKNAALLCIADQIWSEREQIIFSNQTDLEDARTGGIAPAMLDRLMLNENRIEGIVADLRRVVQLPDPVGEVFEAQTLPNGLRVHKQRVPLGVLAVIYEARPNVTVDVTGLALKSGNCAILRGGSETIRSNRALVGAIRRGLESLAGKIPVDAIQLISDTDRQLVYDLLQMEQYIDMVIPRGGAGLHEFCQKKQPHPSHHRGDRHLPLVCG
jgi:glutamate-5-semialdehyde dehydrogenase